ncbi:MAG: hypothetical protein Q9213_004954 [Squamulea squamosa]
MAANMPAWVAKTLDFLGHPRGSQTTSALALPQQLQQAPSYSKALPPLPRKAHLERQRARPSKRSRRSHRYSPPLGNNSLKEKAPTPQQETAETVNYEDQATQTDETQVKELQRHIPTAYHSNSLSCITASPENNPMPWDSPSPQTPDLDLSPGARQNPHGKLKARPELGKIHATGIDSKDNIVGSKASVTSIPPREIDETRMYHDHDKLSETTRLQSPANSDWGVASIIDTDGRAAIGYIDSDGQVLQSPVVDLGSEELLATNADMMDGPPYTAGPAQVVRANDGLKDCLALLLTSELVTKISQIATRARRLEYIKGNLRRMKHEVETEKNMIEYKTDAIQDTTDQKKIAQINREIEDTQKRLAAAVKCVDAIEDEIMTLTDNLAFSRDQCQEIFEDVLGKEDLLEVSDPEVAREVDPMSLSESKYGAKPSMSQEAILDAEGQSGEETIGVELEDVVRRTAKEEFEEKRNIFYTLDEAFEHRQENLAEEKAEYLRRVRDGTCGLSQTEFDLLALEDFQRLTANLKQAEEEFEDAFKRAKQLGVLDDHDAYYQQSIFSEWSGGYPMSLEHAMAGCAPTERIRYWQDSIDQSPDGAGAEPWANPELEPERWEMEDCDIKSVAISDSWSCVDWTRNRRRINRWREIAGRDR